MSEYDREISRTANYVVLSRRRATLVFGSLLRAHMDAAKYRDYSRELRGELDDERELLRSALHQLALATKKEPQSFTRTWLATQRGLNATGEEVRPETNGSDKG